MCGPDNNTEHPFNRWYMEYQSAGNSNDRLWHRSGDRCERRYRFCDSNSDLYITYYVPYDTGSNSICVAIGDRRLASGM